MKAKLRALIVHLRGEVAASSLPHRAAIAVLLQQAIEVLRRTER